jgi:hypothetical protein
MSSEDLVTLSQQVASIATQMQNMEAALKKLTEDIAPLLRWKVGVVAVVGFGLFVGFIVELVRNLADIFRHAN